MECFSKQYIFICIIAIFTTLTQTYASDNWNVCTITINSENEKKVLQKTLDPSKFTFTELTKLVSKEDQNKKSFLLEACEKGIQCDVLVISGHFGGTFFGDSGYRLSLENIEEMSCNKKCDGVLKKPIEVYLFGCNTLAGKEKDHRTFEEYSEVLVRDGFTRHDAEQIAESRYGVWGSSNYNRIMRAFSNVPHIYGFSSVAPSGVNIEKSLDTYFKTTNSSYSKWLKEEELKRTLKLSNYAQSQLTKTLNQKYPFLECNPASNQEGFQTDAVKFICDLQGSSLSNEQKLRLIHEKLNSAKYVDYFPYIESWLSQNCCGEYQLDSNARKEYEKITNDVSLKIKIDKFEKQMKSNFNSLKVLKLQNNLGWKSNDDIKNEIHTRIKKMFYIPMSLTDRDWICSLGHEFLNGFQIKHTELPDGYLNDFKMLDSLDCMPEVDGEIIDKIYVKSKTSKKYFKYLGRSILYGKIMFDPAKHIEMLDAYIVSLAEKGWALPFGATEGTWGLLNKQNLKIYSILKTNSHTLDGIINHSLKVYSPTISKRAIEFYSQNGAPEIPEVLLKHIIKTSEYQIQTRKEWGEVLQPEDYLVNFIKNNPKFKNEFLAVFPDYKF